MTKHVARCLVDHRNFGLTPQAVTKLALHHAESGLDVGSLVVVLQEAVPSELKVVIHLLPRSPALPVVFTRG
jgi:hypothetical protein